MKTCGRRENLKYVTKMALEYKETEIASVSALSQLTWTLRKTRGLLHYKTTFLVITIKHINGHEAGLSFQWKDL